jgi:hypothetical protein
MEEINSGRTHLGKVGRIARGLAGRDNVASNRRPLPSGKGASPSFDVRSWTAPDPLELILRSTPLSHAARRAGRHTCSAADVAPADHSIRPTT